MSENISRRTLANAIRFLAVDAVEKAKSGHPGAPMGMADIAEVLWRDHLKHNPANPQWSDRDRFVLSNGHGSMLAYALLHLTGYDLPLDELKNFRQLGSRTAGHPEVGHTPGIETTTGPLGQGLSNAVGMALAEKLLAQRYNKPGLAVVDHRTWVFVGDGCLMEGISHEACSLAGVWGLDKLTCFYDDNGISIDGHVEGWFRDDTPARFRAYGWHVIGPVDGHDAAAVAAAIGEAREVRGKPTLIVCRTQIGWGSPNKVGTHDVHGAPLGADEAAATRAALGWPHAPSKCRRKFVRPGMHALREQPPRLPGRPDSPLTVPSIPNWRSSSSAPRPAACRSAGRKSAPNCWRAPAGAAPPRRPASLRKTALTCWSTTSPNCLAVPPTSPDPT